MNLNANFRSVFLLLAISSFGAPALSFGTDDQWQSGWGQGVSEAIITHGPGNQIYVTCNDGGNPFSKTGISFMLGGRAPTGEYVTLTFDDNDPENIWINDGEITSDCRACAGNYEYVIEKFKTHSSVHVLFENGDSARFTLKGSSSAITSCVPDFAR